MLAGVMNQPPPEHADGGTGACLPWCRPGAGRRVYEHGMADGRAGGVGDAHRVEYLTLHVGEEKAVRGGGARGWSRVADPFHEGQHVPEDGEVDVVIVRHLLVDLLDALPDLFPRRITGFEDQVAVEAKPCPVSQQFPERDGVDARAFDPIGGKERPDPAVDAAMMPGQ
jgi:hypothetical protein